MSHVKGNPQILMFSSPASYNSGGQLKQIQFSFNGVHLDSALKS